MAIGRAVADRLWVADVTRLPTGSGFLYLAVVTDAWSHRLWGAWRPHLSTAFVPQAPDMVIWQRQPEAVIHPGGRTREYPSIAFGMGVRLPNANWEKCVLAVVRWMAGRARLWPSGWILVPSSREAADCRGPVDSPPRRVAGAATVRAAHGLGEFRVFGRLRGSASS